MTFGTFNMHYMLQLGTAWIGGCVIGALAGRYIRNPWILYPTVVVTCLFWGNVVDFILNGE